MNDRQHLTELVKAADLFRGTPIVEDRFHTVRDGFDKTHTEAAAFLKKPRPKIVCLCGSTKFKEQFIKETCEQSLAGNVVLSVCWFSHVDGSLGEKAEDAFRKLHFAKIDIADEVIVIMVGGYIGESTRAEIEYAKEIGKPITYRDHP